MSENKAYLILKFDKFNNLERSNIIYAKNQIEANLYKKSDEIMLGMKKAKDLADLFRVFLEEEASDE